MIGLVRVVGSLALGSLLILGGCANGSEEAYKAEPAYSGRKASLPTVPTLPTTPIKAGDAYTVYGASHHLRSRIHSSEVTKNEIAIVGYIVESNIETAPACAIHKTGKGDADDCKSPIPMFAIADTKGDTSENRIKVMGWASNFAQVFDAMEKYKGKKDPPKELVKDELWAVDLPFPLPAKGAKVKVTGKYGDNFSRASSGLVGDPIHGVMTYSKLEYLEPSEAPAAFPTAGTTNTTSAVATKKK